MKVRIGPSEVIFFPSLVLLIVGLVAAPVLAIVGALGITLSLLIATRSVLTRRSSLVKRAAQSSRDEK